MKVNLRKSGNRGFFDHGWLRTHHSFSFASYNDPQHVHFRHLRVINEDYIAPKQGFGTHGHQNMEIITYVINGELAHKDSMGNGSTILPGEVQYMSAGTGVTHSEFCPSASEETHLLQIWIFPDKKEYPPKYDQKKFQKEQKRNSLKLIASQSGKNDSIAIRQDVNIYASLLEESRKVEVQLEKDRAIWVQVISGSLKVSAHDLQPGDGLSIEDHVGKIEIESHAPSSEFLLFDLC